jgi:N6-adenosine-specific RNA methylase IME4
VLLFKRGSGLPRKDRGVGELIDAEVIDAQRGGHSVKPVEAMVRLERLCGDVRRIELFARQARSGWTG